MLWFKDIAPAKKKARERAKWDEEPWHVGWYPQNYYVGDPKELTKFDYVVLSDPEYKFNDVAIQNVKVFYTVTPNKLALDLTEEEWKLARDMLDITDGELTETETSLLGKLNEMLDDDS